MENCHPRKHLVRGNLVFWLLCACVPERTEHPKAHPWRIIGSYNENHISSTYFKVEMISSDHRDKAMMAVRSQHGFPDFRYK